MAKASFLQCLFENIYNNLSISDQGKLQCMPWAETVEVRDERIKYEAERGSKQ